MTQPLVNKQGTAAVYTLIATTAPSDLATEDLVSRLRDTTIPKATKGQDMTAFVGGTTAAYVDLAEKITSKLPLVILVVAALSFLVLLVGFRSLLIPAQAAVMNLVSVGAAYGVLTLVFQEGFASSLIGLDGAIPVVSFVPLIMFAILFGLSTDYQVFLLTQIQEHFHEGKGARATVIEGLGYSGRIIGAAALVMFSVFGSFVLNGDPTIKQFGLGLATAVTIDAIVVCLFVPALITVAGRKTIWLPHWLDRILPRISIEGAGYFDDKPPPAPRHPSRNLRQAPDLAASGRGLERRPAADGATAHSLDERRGVGRHRVDVGLGAAALVAERVGPERLADLRARPRARAPARAAG